MSVAVRTLQPMSRHHLHPDVALGIRLSAICSRHRYTTDPQPVIDELLATAGDRADILAAETGSWAGYYDGPDTHTLAAALIAHIPGAADWVHLGRARRTVPIHGASGFARSR